MQNSMPNVSISCELLHNKLVFRVAHGSLAISRCDAYVENSADSGRFSRSYGASLGFRAWGTQAFIYDLRLLIKATFMN